MQVQVKMNTDARPFFSRPPCHVGIYIDFLEAVPLDMKEYGSQQYMNMDIMDKLYQELSKIPLEKVKGEFERRGIMNGAIVEKWNKGVVLSISFHSEGCLDSAWKEYSSDRVKQVLKKFLVTPDLRKALGVSSIELRANMWEDEYSACKKELVLRQVKPSAQKDRDNDIKMIRSVREYQKNSLVGILQSLREDYADMDSSFSQLTMTLRKSIPIKVIKIINFNQFETYYNQIKATKKQQQLKPFEDYISMRGRILEIIEKLEDHISHPLAQVHPQCETENQQDVKLKMKTEVEHMKERLTNEYDWSSLKHPEWINKILNRDHNLFLGMASVIGAGIDTISEIDIQCDEYVSGVDWVKI